MGDRSKLGNLKDGDAVTVGTLKTILGEFFEKQFEKQLSAIKDTLKDTKEEVAIIQKKVKEHDDRLDQNDRYQRRNNIVIHGIPYHKEEKPFQVAVDLGKALGQEIFPGDLDAAHRLKSSNDAAPPPFIIRFVNRWRRDDLMYTMKEKKPTADLLGGDSNKRLFCHEHLSPNSQEIWSEARKHKDYFYLWSWKGDIYGRTKIEGSKPKMIQNIEVAKQLLNELSEQERSSIRVQIKKKETTTANKNRRPVETAIPNDNDGEGIPNNQLQLQVPQPNQIQPEIIYDNFDWDTDEEEMPILNNPLQEPNPPQVGPPQIDPPQDPVAPVAVQENALNEDHNCLICLQNPTQVAPPCDVPRFLTIANAPYVHQRRCPYCRATINSETDLRVIIIP